MFALVVIYFILVHRNHKRVAHAYDERGSYLSASQSGVTVDAYSDARAPDARRHRLEEMAGAVGLGAALSALRRRSSGHHRRDDEMSNVTASQAPRTGPTDSHMTEKFTESSGRYEEPPRASWRDRLIGPTAGIAGLAAAKKFIDRRRERRDDRRADSIYQGPPDDSYYSRSAVHLNEVEEGRRPMPQRRDHWQEVEDRERAQQSTISRPDLQSRISAESYDSYNTPRKSEGQPRRFGFPGTAGTLGALGGFKRIGSYFRRRRERDEDQRVQAQRLQEQEDEQLYGPSSAQRLYKGDGTPVRGGRVGSTSPVTDRTGSPTRSRYGGRSTVNDGSPQPRTRANIPPPPRSRSKAPQPPVHSSSPSEPITSPSQHPTHHDFHQTGNVSQQSPPLSPPPAAAAASGSLLSPPVQPLSRQRNYSSSPHEGVESPPVSVKVKMHNDGRHVTLRRLNDEEAAHEREARRRERRREGRAGHEDDLSEDPNPNAGQRFRRGGGTPYAGPSQAGAAGTPPSQQQPSDLQLPPQGQPAVSPPSAAGGMGSSPHQTGTGTDVSDYDNNRRRRRAERARAEAQRAAAGKKTGPRVEFQ